MDNLDVLKRRILSRGATKMDRMNTDKQKTLIDIMEEYYNNCNMEFNTVGFTGVIHAQRMNLESDDEVFIAPFNNSFTLGIGSSVLWLDNNTHWLITTHELKERAYFRGTVKRALYEIKWRGDDNNVYSVWAALIGPSEKNINTASTQRFKYDTPNNTMTLWFEASAHTGEIKKYEKLIVADKVWKVTNLDNITTPGIVEMFLVEDYENKEVDNAAQGIARDYDLPVITAESNHTNVIDGTTIVYDSEDGLAPIKVYTIYATLIGSWSLSNTSIASISACDNKNCTIDFAADKYGSTILSYTVGGKVVAEKVIKRTTLFG